MPINVNLPANGASGGDVRAVRAQPLGAEEKKGRTDQGWGTRPAGGLILKEVVNRSHYKVPRIVGALDCSDRDTKLWFWGPSQLIRALRQKPHPLNALKIGISRKGPQVGFGRFHTYHILVFGKSLEDYSKVLEYLPISSCWGLN